MAKYYGASAEYNKPKGFKFDRRTLKMVSLGLIVLIILTVAFTFISSITNSTRNDLILLVARQSSMQNFINENQETIKGGELSRINSSANLLVLTGVSSMKDGLKESFGVDRVPDDITKAEADTASEAELLEAEQLGRFDQTYHDLLRDKLASTLQLARKVETGARGELKTNLQQNINSLKTIDDQLEELKL